MPLSSGHRTPVSPLVGCAIGLAVAAVGTAVRWALDPLFADQAPLLVQVPGVVAAAWLGGFGGGVCCIAASAAAADYLFIEPRHTFLPLTGQDAARLAAFIVIGLALAWQVARWHRVERALRRTIAERDRARETLQRYEVLAEESRDVMLFVGRRTGRVIEANEAAARAYGYSREELRSLTIHQLRAPGVAGLTETQMAQADTEGILFESTHRRRDGTVFPVEVSSRGAMLGTERVLVSIIRDVTERKRQEQAIREAEKRLSALMNAATESIYLINRDDVIVAANVTAAARLKRPVDQVVGRCWRELVPPQLVEERRRRLEQVLTTGRPARFEDERDGIVFDHSFFPVGQAGEPTSAVAIFSRDITEQKRAAEERERLYADAQEANRAKDEFLATLSHELRTPLHAIQGWAQMLVSGSLDAARQRQGVEAIARNASLQARLVDEVLDLSRIVSGRFHVHQATANVAVFIQRALDTIAPAAAAKDITIASSVPHDVVMAGDADRLQQVMWNLLSNAVKFTPAGGRVTVRAQVAESSIEIQVEDTGVGIAEEFRPYLFERFSQADSSRTRRHGGLGLGLAIARHIVELHGGRITATSAGEGHGAVFTLSLPLHAVSPGTALAAPRVDDAWKEAVDASSLRGVAVLAVDDDQDSRQMLETMLTAAGASVTTCSSAREAFQALSRVRPDAIVSDIGMPDEDGYTFIGKVRALSGPSGNTAAVALTAYGHANDVAHALAAGYDRHLSKPVGAASLVQAIAQAIRQRAAGAPDRPHLPGAST